MDGGLFGKSVFDRYPEAFALTNTNFRAGHDAIVAPGGCFTVRFRHESRPSRCGSQRKLADCGGPCGENKADGAQACHTCGTGLQKGAAR